MLKEKLPSSVVTTFVKKQMDLLTYVVTALTIFDIDSRHVIFRLH